VRRRRPGRLRPCSSADRASVGALSRGARTGLVCAPRACTGQTGRRGPRCRRQSLAALHRLLSAVLRPRRSRPRPRRAGRLSVPSVSVTRVAQRAWRHPFATSAVPAVPQPAEKAVQLLPERRLDHVSDVRPGPAPIGSRPLPQAGGESSASAAASSMA